MVQVAEIEVRDLTFNDKVVHELCKQGVSRQELARHMGVSYSYINKLMADERRWSEEKMRSVARYLGFEITYC